MIKIARKSKKVMRKKWDERVAQLKKECVCDFAFDDLPIKPQRVMHEVQKVIDDKTIITTEVGQCQMWAMHFLKIMKPRHFISSGGLGTMGFGFPAALGAKVAKPDHRIIDVAGDGSFLMVCQDLATSVEYDIPVTVVVLHNQWLGMVRQWQDLFYERRFSATNLGPIPDFTKIAEAHNAKGIKVTRPNEILPALKEAVKSDVTTVVDIMIDPEEKIFPMVPAGASLADMIDCKRR
jgi:acetolactate synthase-1/2/3 large subunit